MLSVHVCSAELLPRSMLRAWVHLLLQAQAGQPEPSSSLSVRHCEEWRRRRGGHRGVEARDHEPWLLPRCERGLHVITLVKRTVQGMCGALVKSMRPLPATNNRAGVAWFLVKRKIQQHTVSQLCLMAYTWPKMLEQEGVLPCDMQ